MENKQNLTELNFDLTIKNLDGLDYVPDPVHAGKNLAQFLAHQTKGDAVKLFGWALALNSKAPIYLDESDLKTLKTLIADAELAAITKAALLKVFDK